MILEYLRVIGTQTSTWHPKTNQVHFSKGDSLRANIRPQVRISRLNWTDKWNTYVDVDVVNVNNKA